MKTKLLVSKQMMKKLCNFVVDRLKKRNASLFLTKPEILTHAKTFVRILWITSSNENVLVYISLFLWFALVFFYWNDPIIKTHIHRITLQNSDPYYNIGIRMSPSHTFQDSHSFITKSISRAWRKVDSLVS